MTLWGGRFSGTTDEAMRRFNDSISFDVRLYDADVRGSIAWARALSRAGLITSAECDQLVAGLEKVRAEFETGVFGIRPGDEDIHTAVERRLGELVGSVAGKLHTGRSRNDQVATDLRLYVMDKMASLGHALADLQQAIVDKAEACLHTSEVSETSEAWIVMPGYTHMQQAQPILFSHWLMSFFWKFQRDRERLADVARQTSSLPLGCGAIAGTPFAIDREALAAEVGFVGLCENSVDAVSDRDFVVEFMAWAALLQAHLSGLAEDLILWASREFGFVALDDAYSTGSSLMPQKKNPDSLELMRGKTGRVIGHLAGMLTTLKGLPSGYNKDLQEDKEALFDTADTLALELPIAAGVIRTLKVNAERMAAALDDAMLATDLADYLVRRGIPFRESHGMIGQAVKRAEALGMPLGKMPLAEYRAIHPAFGEDLYTVFDFRRSVALRQARGGTAPPAVQEQIARARAALAGT